jgi:biopolymer transport protein ExbB/TolQ
MDGSIWDLMNHGGYAMWFIVGFSVISVAVAIERAIAQWQFTTRARALADTVERCLSRGALDEGRSACERSPSPLADVFLVGYERLGRGKREYLASAVHRERQRVAQDLRSRLWVLATVGATAPFVGLFGTVVGIVSAFHMMGVSGQGGLGTVSAGIAEALVATALGILVAIPALWLFNHLTQRIQRMLAELECVAEELAVAVLGDDVRERARPRYGVGR